MYHILAFLTKAPHLTTPEFISHYETQHIPLIVSLSGPSNQPLVYKRRYTHRDSTAMIGDWLSVPEKVDFDVVTELVFRDEAASKAWGEAIGRDGGGERVVRDEERFLDRSRTKVAVVQEEVTCG